MVLARALLIALVLVTLSRHAMAADAAIFRLYLLNGDTLTSFGEFARVDDRVIFSMIVGGTADDPRLQVVTIPAGMIDWDRTNRHLDSARYQRYVATRGEADFELLTTEVARVLSQIAFTTDRSQALTIAEQARRTLADWPRAHFGYRQDDVREVIGFLDNAIRTLRGETGGGSGFELSLVASTPAVMVEPLARPPAAHEQLDQIGRIVAMTTQPGDRVALWQAAMALLDEARGSLPGVDVVAMRRSFERSVREELAVDARYASLARRLTAEARRHAAAARVGDTEKLLSTLRRDDERMGRLRPDVVRALETTLLAQAEAARQLRLLRDRWALRRSLYADYQRSVGSQMVQLVKSRSQLEAIRRLDGPELQALQALGTRLSGGAERLGRLNVPDDMRSAHDLLVSAWRFAEAAARTRLDAVASANIVKAREASSAAAGALLLFNRAQQEIRTYLEPPRLP